MKAVSAAYQAAMQLPMRNPSKCRVMLENLSTTPVDEDDIKLIWGSVTTTPHFPGRYTESAGTKYATFELNRWVLDGSFDLLPDETVYPEGIANLELSDEQGQVLSDGTPIQAKLSIEPIPPATFTGFTVAFNPDNGLDEPLGADVAITAASGDVTETVSGEAFAETGVYQYDGATEEASEITVTFDKVLPYHYLYLSNFYLGTIITFEDDKLVTVKLNADVDPVSRRLPQNTLSVTFLDYEGIYDPDNPNGLYDWLFEGSPMWVQFGYDVSGEGDYEWLTPTYYNLTGDPVFSRNQVTLTGVNILSRMKSLYYKSELAVDEPWVTLGDLAAHILSDAKLPVAATGRARYEIDPSLYDIHSRGAVPIATHAECLQMVAHAAGCTLWVDNYDVIHIAPVRDALTQTDFAVDFSTTLLDTPSTTKSPLLGNLRINRYTFGSSSAIETLFDGDSTEEDVFHLEYPDMYRDVEVTMNGRYAPATVWAHTVEAEMLEARAHVKVTGQPIPVSTLTDTSESIHTAGQDDVEDNPLITEYSVAQNLLTLLKWYYEQRTTYTMSYRGNPELEPGDIVTVQTRWAENLPAIVLTTELTYNGTLRGGLTLKGVSAWSN